MPSPLRTLTAYLQAFEVAYESDDWNVLDDHLSRDCVYHVIGAGPFTGKWVSLEAVKKQFNNIVNVFDRRFDARIPELLGRPKLSGDSILFKWKATYKLKGAPDFLLHGDSAAKMSDGKITELVDNMSAAECLAAEKYLRDWKSALKTIP